MTEKITDPAHPDYLVDPNATSLERILRVTDYILQGDCKHTGSTEISNEDKKNHSLEAVAYLSNKIGPAIAESQRNTKNSYSTKEHQESMEQSAELEKVKTKFIELITDLGATEKSFITESAGWTRTRTAISRILGTEYLNKVKLLYNEMVNEEKLPSAVYEEIKRYWPLAGQAVIGIIPRRNELSNYESDKAINNREPDENYENKLRADIKKILSPLLRRSNTIGNPRQFNLSDPEPETPDHSEPGGRVGHGR